MRLLAASIVSAILTLTILPSMISTANAEESAEREGIIFDIPAQSLGEALQALARQADLQILFTAESVGALRAPPLTGRMTVQHALDALLKGTMLEHLRTGDVIVIRERPVTHSAAQSEASPGDALLLATADGAAPEGASVAQTPDKDRPSSPAPASSEAAPLGEIIVTGTLVRGATPVSPVVTIDRAEIERGGYATVQQVIDRLPQNFGGGDNEGTLASPGGSFLNTGFGSSANLHGLGSDSTLTLLNGQRVAPAGYGQFVDLSMIPLSAVERVEVVADGASATYGSDAVGGVVNIILRDNYEGADTSLRAGTATSGDVNEYQASQTFGRQWDRSSAFVTYEFHKRGALDANARDFSEDLADPFDLLPSQRSNSIVASGKLRLTNSVALRGTALYSVRDATHFAFSPTTGVPNLSEVTTRQLNTVVGTTIDISDAWQADLVGLYSENRLSDAGGPPGLLEPQVHNQLSVTSADATLRGPHVALGASFRDEDFTDLFAGTPRLKRQVGAAFAEYSRTFHRVDLSLAARYEHYSDFGSTTNPKVGIAWTPVTGVKLRGTYGRAFRAPLLTELDDSNLATVLLDFPDPAAADGTTLTMLESGNNADLTPEKATTWTAGLDLALPSLPGSKLSLTYFNTRFNDRITGPLPGFEILGIYAQADVYAPIINRNPDPAIVAELAANPIFFNLHGSFAPEDVQAIVDRRLQNISETDVTGLDISLEQRFESRLGEWAFRLDATDLLNFKDAITSTARADDVLSSVYHAIDFKGRGSVTWSRNAWLASTTVNYVDASVNDTVTPSTSVAAWTTVDLHVEYTLPGTLRILGNTRSSLDVQNAFDREPPFVESPVATFDLGYDPTNASPLGRFISLSLVKSW
jgi:outer membrane cobalamin receptor